MAKSELSRDAIVDRALAVADQAGLDAVTVRRIAQDLGVTPMALYWHVKNKDELLDAMGDRLFETVDYDPAATASWDDQLRAVTRALAEAFRRHPSCVDLAYRRVFACEQGQRLAEYTLGLLRDAGFGKRHTVDIATRALQTALMLVTSEPGAEPGVDRAELATVLDAKRAALQRLPIEQFPHIRELAADLLHCDDVEGYYAFNIDLFVAGARATLAGPVAPIASIAPVAPVA